MSDDLFFQEKKGRKLYFTPVLNKGKRSEINLNWLCLFGVTALSDSIEKCLSSVYLMAGAYRERKNMF